MLEMRTFENRPGQVYDPTDLTRLFAEDINAIVEYINDLPSGSSSWTESSGLLYPATLTNKVLFGRDTDDGSSAVIQTDGNLHVNDPYGSITVGNFAANWNGFSVVDGNGETWVIGNGIGSNAEYSWELGWHYTNPAECPWLLFSESQGNVDMFWATPGAINDPISWLPAFSINRSTFNTPVVTFGMTSNDGTDANIQSVGDISAITLGKGLVLKDTVTESLVRITVANGVIVANAL